MGQLTISRFRGDTTFGLIARIVSTFAGGLIGVVMWYVEHFERFFFRVAQPITHRYISAGDGRGKKIVQNVRRTT